MDEIKEIHEHWHDMRKFVPDSVTITMAYEDIHTCLSRIDELERWVTQLLREKGIEAA
jgi:hypothetical protein